jgi:hypothetical protein
MTTRRAKYEVQKKERGELTSGLHLKKNNNRKHD